MNKGYQLFKVKVENDKTLFVTIVNELQDSCESFEISVRNINFSTTDIQRKINFCNDVLIEFNCKQKAIRDKERILLLRHNPIFVDWYMNIVYKALKEGYKNLEILKADSQYKLFPHWLFYCRGFTMNINFSFIEQNYKRIEDFINDCKDVFLKSNSFNIAASDFHK